MKQLLSNESYITDWLDEWSSRLRPVWDQDDWWPVVTKITGLRRMAAYCLDTSLPQYRLQLAELEDDLWFLYEIAIIHAGLRNRPAE